MKEEQKNGEGALLLVLVLTSLIVFSSITVATPTGPSSINITSNETKSTTGGQVVNISGGRLSKLNVTATVQNPHWKAFAGWIDGRFTLDDASGSTIYDWTLTSISGEVYATRNSTTPTWTEIGCANSTEIDSEDSLMYHTGEDNISSTFAGTNSDTYVTAGITITAGSCSATNTYVNNVTQSSVFEETILFDNSSIIFAAMIDANSTGYDGSKYDFQMIVPENGSDLWTSATAYYLYVELS